MCESLGKSMLIQIKSFQNRNTQNQPIKESKVINKTCSTLPQINLKDIQDNRYLINFKGGNTIVIDKMQKMVKSKSKAKANATENMAYRSKMTCTPFEQI